MIMMIIVIYFLNLNVNIILQINNLLNLIKSINKSIILVQRKKTNNTMCDWKKKKKKIEKAKEFVCLFVQFVFFLID